MEDLVEEGIGDGAEPHRADHQPGTRPQTKGEAGDGNEGDGGGDEADGRQVFIGITSDKQWKLFCNAFGRADLLAPEYATNDQRRAAYDILRPVVAEIALRHTAEELIEKLVPLGCPVGLAARPGDLFDDPQLNHEGRMSETTLVNGRTVKLPRLPIILSASKDSPRPSGHVPNFGEHTDEVLGELGFTPDEVAAMRNSDAVR